ncbi:MAG: bifunctional methylenetetrahydrofolate dehydrogenase/methenyltetrahydrofolate cyclohydrolase FolD [Alphaproteobacteria bacterium]
MTDNKIIDGKAFAANLRAQIAVETDRLRTQHGITPGLAMVLVGEDPASQVYVRNKSKAVEEAGMHSDDHHLPADTSAQDLLALVRDLNDKKDVNGILVQLPLPGGIDADKVIDTIDPDKDVDGFHVVNAGRLATGGKALVPCTPQGCMMLLKDRLGDDLAGRKALILGRSNIVGKPMGALLLRESCTVTTAHSKTRDLPGECRQADILIAAVGRPHMVKGDWIKPGAAVIDVGINRIPAPTDENPDRMRLVGDVDFDEAVQIAGAITPVPGGVGPMTIACLLRNTLIAACRQHGVDEPAV